MLSMCTKSISISERDALILTLREKDFPNCPASIPARNAEVV
jgi:hypothetical protein